jgi:hypothetical protein
MICPRCNTDYPVEFFEEHHKNHIHNDNSEGNVVVICVKCHKRHHMESGYDTIILKKDSYQPRTLEDIMVEIDREEFLKAYRGRLVRIFNQSIIQSQEIDESLLEWIKSNPDKPIDMKGLNIGGFTFTGR